MNLFEKIGNLYYNIKNGIKNIFLWFPIIWKDRWWDHYYIYYVLHRKLEMMEKNIRKHGHHIDNEKDAHKIRIAKCLLKRLIDDNYLINALEPHEKKWGEMKMETTKIEDTDLCSVDIYFPIARSLNKDEQCNKEYKRVSEHSYNMRKQDIIYLFDHMKKHVETWWD